MSIKFGFFNSVNGDRKYNAEDMTMYFDKIVSDGVFHDVESDLQVVPLSGMTVQVTTGRGLIKCRWLQNDSYYNLTHDPSHVILDRVDRVVMRLNLNESARNMELAIIKGTPYDPSDTPVLPPLSSDPLITELTLATVLIAHDTDQIISANITDRRPDPGYCGWVRSLVESSGGGTLRKYQTYQTLTSEVSAITPGIAQYTPGSVLQIYVGGIMLTENIEYTMSGTGSTAIAQLRNTIRAGNTITCVLLTTE